jgi:hypothetical protein
MKLKDPFAKKGLAPWKKFVITLSVVIVVAAGLWIFNLLNWAGLKSPLPRYNEPAPVEVVVESEAEAQTDSVTVEVAPAE